MPTLPYHFEFDQAHNVPGDVRIFISRLIPVIILHYPFPWKYKKEQFLGDDWDAHFDWVDFYNNKTVYLPEGHKPQIEIAQWITGDHPYADTTYHSSIFAAGFSPPRLDHTLHLDIECQLEVEFTRTPRCIIQLKSDHKLVFDQLKRKIDSILARFKSS